MQDPPEYGWAGARLKFPWQCTGLSGDWKVTWTRVAFLDCQPRCGVHVHLKCVFSRHAVHCHELHSKVTPRQPLVPIILSPRVVFLKHQHCN